MAFEGVYAADVLGLVLMCSNPDTTYLPVFSAVRLMRIDMYDIGAPSSDIQISQMQLQWNSTQGPAQTETVSGTPLHPGTISSRPPKKSLCSDWINWSNTDVDGDALFWVSMGINSYIDLSIEGVLNTSGNTILTGTASTSTAGVVGQLYVNRLDASSAGYLHAVGVEAL